MHPTSFRQLVFFVTVLVLVIFAPPLAAKTSAWTAQDAPGFRAEPVEVLGPWALFNNSWKSGRRVLLRGLPSEECRRFYRETSPRPPRADLWSEAKGIVTSELPGRVMRVKDKGLVPVDLADRPEPEVVVVLFGSHNDGESWTMANNFIPTYRRIQQVYPGRSETLFFGVRENAAEQSVIATGCWMPWLVADHSQQAAMSRIARFAPAEGILMLALSRDGSPLLSSRADTLDEIKRFIDELSDLLRQTDPSNPDVWRDRLHYLDAVRPEQFADSLFGPVLVGDPLRAEGLRQRGISEVQARVEVRADGHPSSVVVKQVGGVTPAMASALAEALRKSTLFSPAIDHGRPVEAAFDYRFSVPSGAPAPAADIAWLRGDARIEVALNDWLVLRPIPVPQAGFSSLDHVDAGGTAVYTSFQVGTGKVSRTAQMNAFNSDWFGDTGAAQVLPAEGQHQVVDEVKLTWQKVLAHEGYVNLQTAGTRDYCVGYAWAEMEIPKALDGWLGIGSDDGLKIWLNGELVHDRWIRRVSRIDDDIVALHMRAGKNRLLIKIQNATGDWSFISRLRLRQP